jgi:branched-chain amino acid transport system permease protein
MKHKQTLLIGLLLAALTFLPMAVSSDYVLRVFIMAGVYVVLTLSLNLVSGFAGQFCLGWAAFYGIGAYTSALLSMKLHVSFWLGLPAAGLMAALFGVILGIPTMRLSGNYLTITTLGFGEIIRLILLNWTDLTRGAMGLPGIPSPELFGKTLDSKYFYYYLIVAIVLATVWALYRIIDSRFGRALLAISEDELAAKAMGMDVTKYKVMAFAVGAFFAGIAGSFYAHYTSFIDPNTFSFGESIIILAMVVLGGMGSIPGSVVGAVLLTLLPEALRGAAEYRMILFGLILMLVMLFKPSGLMGKGKNQRTKKPRIARRDEIDSVST